MAKTSEVKVLRLKVGDFIIAKVNVDENPELSQKFSIRSIPALFIIQNGTVQESMNGLQTEATLTKKIRQYSK